LIAFDVWLDGKRLCRAGIAGPGVVTAIVDRVERPSVEVGGRAAPEDPLNLHVGGLESTTGDHLDWAKRALTVGTEIRLTVVETNEVDPPQRRKSERREVKFCCSFCGGPSDEARRVIAGPNDANICNECVSVCIEQLKS
jgi:hypothetical protein